MIGKFDKEYKWLSNFAPCTIVLNGITYPSVEHAYMSAKSDDVRWYLKCTDENIKPGTIKKMSRQILLVRNWDAIKVDVMRECLNQKFRQEPYKALLLATGEAYIQEGNRWGDTFWGVDLKSKLGANHLGKLIMEIRDQIKSEDDARTALLSAEMRKAFAAETGRVKSISLDQLQSELNTDAQKKAFWINLYNASYQVLRLENKMPRSGIFTQKAIVVAGLRLSLDDIEHGILRRNRIKWSLGYLPNPFAPGILKRLAVSRLDHRIHFALNCGARSCPPIAFYAAGKIDQQLEMAMLAFIESETEVLREQKEVRISRLFLWYLGDFGGYRGIRRLLQEKTGLDTRGLRLRPAHYDWTERLDNFVE